MDVTSMNQREVMLPFLHQIRFTTMTLSSFWDDVETTGILTEKEAVSITRTIGLCSSIADCGFPSNPRCKDQVEEDRKMAMRIASAYEGDDDNDDDRPIWGSIIPDQPKPKEPSWDYKPVLSECMTEEEKGEGRGVPLPSSEKRRKKNMSNNKPFLNMKGFDWMDKLDEEGKKGKKKKIRKTNGKTKKKEPKTKEDNRKKRESIRKHNQDQTNSNPVQFDSTKEDKEASLVNGIKQISVSESGTERHVSRKHHHDSRHQADGDKDDDSDEDDLSYYYSSGNDLWDYDGEY